MSDPIDLSAERKRRMRDLAPTHPVFASGKPVHVPTAPELAHEGLAWQDEPGKNAPYRISDEGHRRMGDALRHNGRIERARHERGERRNPLKGLDQ